jgi:hypothetical protein
MESIGSNPAGSSAKTGQQQSNYTKETDSHTQGPKALFLHNVKHTAHAFPPAVKSEQKQEGMCTSWRDRVHAEC